MPFSSRTALSLILLLAGCSSGADDEGSAGSPSSPQGGSSAAGQGGASAGSSGTAGKGGSGGAAGQPTTGGAAGAVTTGGSGGSSGKSGGPGGTSAGGAGSPAGGQGGAPTGGKAGTNAGGNAGAPAGSAGASGEAQGGEAGQGGTGGQSGNGQAGGQAGSGQAGSGQAGSGQAGSGQAGSGQAGSGQAGSGQAGQGQAGTSGSAGSGGQMACGGPVGSTLIRLNQVGYRPADTKQAMFMGTAPGGTFLVRSASCDVVFQGPVGADLGSWSAGYPHVHALDFSSVTAPGTYTVEVPGSDSGASPSFQIGEGPALYGPLLDSALFFFKAQRDGADVDPAVLGRKPSHLDDAKAFVYSKPTYSNDELTKPLSQIGTGTIDVSGGWFDAGDYLKFVETTSYTEAMMLVAVRDHAAALGAGKDSFHGEGQHGIEWLLRMWDDSSQTLYYQVGIGNGSGALKINGDHDLWRLPEVDDTLPVAPGDPNYFVRFRPALRLAAAGGNISPNLAGRLAADFALCSVVYRPTDAALADRCLSSAEHVYALAHTTTSPTITTTAPKDYYPETSWRDDMELGATELYFAVAGAAGAVPAGLPHSDPAYYLGEAATWAKAYLTSKENGSDSLNLYDVSALAHYELFRALSQAGQPSGLAVGPAELIAGLASQLEAARTQGLQDPFRLGIEYGGGDAAPHAFGLALSADFYEEISGDTQYRSLGQQQRDWALGANAWGSSFVVGAGSTFPRCLQHQIANLAGSFDGTPPILRGAVVAGPTDPASLDGLAGSLLDGMLACPAGGADPFAPFSGHGAQYQDNAADWPTVEPAIDYTAPSILLFARQ